jgi:hypothetical protein
MTSSPVAEFLTTMNTTWDRMVERTEPVTRRLRIAETDIEVALVGADLAAALLPALAWHPPAAGPVSATVGAWDASATGTPLPAPFPHENPLVRQWVVRRGSEPMAEVDWSSPGVVSMGNRYAGRHLLGVADAGIARRQEAAPLRRQLWWALGDDVLFAHAGAVGGPEGAALILGPSGAGKSSTALACARAGMGFLSDDYCLVRGDPPVVHLLAPTARVHEPELRHLGDWASSAVASWNEPGAPLKALLFLHRLIPEQIVASAPVRVLLIPELAAEGGPGLVPVRPADALRMVAPAALWQMHLDAGRELRQLRQLVTAVPTYRLLLSRHRAENALTVARALERATARSA